MFNWFNGGAHKHRAAAAPQPAAASASETDAPFVRLREVGKTYPTGDGAFTAQGFVIWLVIVVVLSVVASLMPARSASRLTIREVLAYE